MEKPNKKAELQGMAHAEINRKKYIKKAELLGLAHVENRIGPG